MAILQIIGGFRCQLVAVHANEAISDAFHELLVILSLKATTPAESEVVSKFFGQNRGQGCDQRAEFRLRVVTVASDGKGDLCSFSRILLTGPRLEHL